MTIEKVTGNKKEYLDLLLLADEQESMVDRYLDKGEMFVLKDPDVKAECVVTDNGGGVAEIKNIAVSPEAQRKGYGCALIRYILEKYAQEYHTMLVGTGDSPLTIPFYERCGFREHHRLKNFFTDHYDHPIFECGKQLVDMVYLSVDLQSAAPADPSSPL